MNMAEAKSAEPPPTGANTPSAQGAVETPPHPAPPSDAHSAPVILPMPKDDVSSKTPEPIDTHHKALQINLDPSKYGTFAEIGAGQEVARWFFRVGGAAGTVAKSISAYDMTVSDAIYGPCERYVTRQRLHNMLDHEYGLLHERLNQKRGATTKFFVFANTVRARGYRSTDESHGWMGLRFQTQPGTAPSTIMIHMRMLEKENVQQQEALGIMGVNLIHAALYQHERPASI